MSVQEFSTTVLLILSIMALLAGVELALPLFAGRSAIAGRRAANAGMTFLALTSTWALSSAAALLALVLPLSGPGRMASLGLPTAVQIAVGVAVLDFGFGYLAHRAMHAWPALWRVHRAHHSDPFVDVTTTYRTHPIEVAWRLLFVVVPVWVLGIPAEAVVLHRLLSAINGLLEHANIRLWPPVDRAVSRVWVTPQMHKVHHSRDARETDSNYGNILSVFDRWLGTFTPTDRAFSVSYGLDDVDRKCSTSLRGLLALPFAADEGQQRAPEGGIAA